MLLPRRNTFDDRVGFEPVFLVHGRSSYLLCLSRGGPTSSPESLAEMDLRPQPRAMLVFRQKACFRQVTGSPTSYAYAGGSATSSHIGNGSRSGLRARRVDRRTLTIDQNTLELGVPLELSITSVPIALLPACSNEASRPTRRSEPNPRLRWRTTAAFLNPTRPAPDRLKFHQVLGD